MVSVSTLPKADKNAILRAKLLDASRRMRAGKIQVAVQTDIIPTKLMKEVNIDIQCDLISRVDKEILTDGAITLRQEGPGEFVLTHSVAQMTDEVLVNEVETQTATPRTTNQFFEEYYKTLPEALNSEQLTDNLSKNEKKLIGQIREIKQINEQLKGIQNLSIDKHNQDADESDLSDDSLLSGDSDFEVPIKSTKFLKKRSYKKPSLLKPTISAWNFNLSDGDESDLQTMSRTRYSEDNKSWYNFKDVVIGKKLANMKLSPIPPRRPSIKKKTLPPWNDAQQSAVAELLNEANALLDVFDQMSLILGPDLKLNDLPAKDNTEIKMLSDRWEPILEQSNFILQQKMSGLKIPKIIKAQPISPEMFEKLVSS